MSERETRKVLEEISRLEKQDVSYCREEFLSFIVRKGMKQMRADLEKAAELRKSIGWD